MSQKLRTTNAGGSSPGAQRKSNFFVEPPIPEAREPSDGVPSDQEGSGELVEYSKQYYIFDT